MPKRVLLVLLVLVVLLLAGEGVFYYLRVGKQKINIPGKEASLVKEHISLPFQGYKATVLQVESDNLVLKLEDGTEAKYYLTKSKLFVLFRKGPVIKAAFGDITIGQDIEFNQEKDENGQAVITRIIIEN